MDFSQMMDEAGTLGEQLSVWAFAVLPNVVAALFILFLGWWIAARLQRMVGVVLGRQGRIDETLRTVLEQIVRYVILIVAGVAALSQLGIQTTSILAALGAIGLAIGLALQNTLSNIAAGIMLLWLRPFSIGDYIETTDSSGSVQEIGLFATRLTTVEGLYVFVPNSELWNKKIVNYSRQPKRMLRETFAISYDDDVEKAREVLLGLLAADSRVHKDPEPIVKVNRLGDSAVELEVRAWTDTSSYLATRWDVIERGKMVLEAEGLSIPYPQQDVHIREIPKGENGSGRLMPVSNA